MAGVPGNDFPTVPEELKYTLQGHLNYYYLVILLHQTKHLGAAEK